MTVIRRPIRPFLVPWARPLFPSASSPLPLRTSSSTGPLSPSLLSAPAAAARSSPSPSRKSPFSPRGLFDFKLAAAETTAMALSSLASGIKSIFWYPRSLSSPPPRCSRLLAKNKKRFLPKRVMRGGKRRTRSRRGRSTMGKGRSRASQGTHSVCVWPFNYILVWIFSRGFLNGEVNNARLDDGDAPGRIFKLRPRQLRLTRESRGRGARERKKTLSPLPSLLPVVLSNQHITHPRARMPEPESQPQPVPPKNIQWISHHS